MEESIAWHMLAHIAWRSVKRPADNSSNGAWTGGRKRSLQQMQESGNDDEESEALVCEKGSVKNGLMVTKFSVVSDKFFSEITGANVQVRQNEFIVMLKRLNTTGRVIEHLLDSFKEEYEDQLESPQIGGSFFGLDT
jgi:hypothetical protein